MLEKKLQYSTHTLNFVITNEMICNVNIKHAVKIDYRRYNQIIKTRDKVTFVTARYC